MRQTTQAAALPSSVTLDVVLMCLRVSQVDYALRPSATPSPRRTLSSRDRCCDDRRDWQVRYVTVPGRVGATTGVKPGAHVIELDLMVCRRDHCGEQKVHSTRDEGTAISQRHRTTIPR
jgi:hypothetical protein